MERLWQWNFEYGTETLKGLGQEYFDNEHDWCMAFVDVALVPSAGEALCRFCCVLRRSPAVNYWWMTQLAMVRMRGSTTQETENTLLFDYRMACGLFVARSHCVGCSVCCFLCLLKYDRVLAPLASLHHRTREVFLLVILERHWTLERPQTVCSKELVRFQTLLDEILS